MPSPHSSRSLTTLLEETDTRQTPGPAAHDDYLSTAVDALVARLSPVLGPSWAGRDRYKRWYRIRGQHLAGNYPYTAARAAARIHTTQLPHPPTDLHHAATHPSWALREAAVQAIASGWADDEGTLPLAAPPRHHRPQLRVRPAAVQAIRRIDRSQ